MAAPTLFLRVIVALSATTGLAERDNRGTPLKEQWPWYHSEEELRASFQDLAKACQGAELSISTLSRVNGAEAAGQEVQLDVLRVRRQGAQPRVKGLFVFGEHAREVVTSEAALTLVQALCGQGQASQHASPVLDSAEFVLVPNANPLGRKLVERGYYCKRTNEDGVDLNRNWSEEDRDTSVPMGDEMYPGPNGFSEPETQLLKDLVDQEQPDIYLSVHSGAYLLGTPYGYDGNALSASERADMMHVLGPISNKYCSGQCPYGNLAQLIHYQNPGCDIDYVYKTLHTPYVFTWEIYVGEPFRDRYIDEARMLQASRDQQGATSLAQRGRRRLRGQARAVAELGMESPEAQEDIGSCMDQFNPQSEADTVSIVQNWAGAFLDLATAVSVRKGGHGPQPQNASSALDSPTKSPRDSLLSEMRALESSDDMGAAQ
mmetsp:Transcript_105742/g.341075  ORF Transcript_105742/g.341075 Transcript_105742/m.341075 type:complete len:432 (+) Transcript_105742:101-1396(+)